MKFNKKGLSDVVTTVLIILIVIVAVAAIWAFVSPAIKNTGTGLNNAQFCLQNIIEPTACKYAANNGLYTSMVTVRRTATTTDFQSVGSVLTTITRAMPTDTQSVALTAQQRSILSASNADGAIVSISDNPATSLPKAVTVTTSYTLKDSTTVSCTSVPIDCST